MIVNYLPIAGASLTVACLIISLFITTRAYYRNKDNKLGDNFVRNNSLSPDGVFSALSRLYSFVKSSPPDYLIGVNRGGVLVGAYICFMLGIKKDKFIVCLVSKKDGKYKVSCPDIKKLN